MAFTFLWKSINNLYAELYLTHNPEKRLQDSAALDLSIESFTSNLNLKIEKDITIRNVLSLYIEKIPDKLTSFIANFILKNHSIRSSFPQSKNLSTSYTTFVSHFGDIYNPIAKTYGLSYEKLTEPQILKNGSFSLKKNCSTEQEINNKEKIHKITRSLGAKIKELMIKRKTHITTNEGDEEYTLELETDKKYINFIIRNILYAIRNNTFHGKIASRLNSKEINNNSYLSSIYTYLLGYFFLTILLYELNYIKKEDLEILVINYENNLK